MHRQHLLMIGIFGLVPLPTMHAQVRAQLNEAILPSTVNAGALEHQGRVAVAYSTYGGFDEWLAGAGIRLGSGSLYALAGERERNRGINAGYAQVLGTHSIHPALSTSVGVDLAGGFLRRSTDQKRSYAAHLSVPFALRAGSPQTLSATGYLAPYFELGRSPSYFRCQDFTCVPGYSGLQITTASGIGAGFRLTAWRFGLDGGFREAFEDRGGNRFVATATLRF